jgi:hypothetical protein
MNDKEVIELIQEIVRQKALIEELKDSLLQERNENLELRKQVIIYEYGKGD